MLKYTLMKTALWLSLCTDYIKRRYDVTLSVTLKNELLSLQNITQFFWKFSNNNGH